METVFRFTVRSLCFHNGSILLEFQKRHPEVYYFPGGGLELGESFEECLQREYQEETNTKISQADYLFVVENIFVYEQKILHSVEHFYKVSLDTYDINSKSGAFVHEWISLDKMNNLDIRPKIVKKAILDGSWKTEKHFSNKR